MNPSDKRLNPFEPALMERAQIDPVDLRTIVWENQNASVMSCQLIVVALSMGVLTFAGYAFFQGSNQIYPLPNLTALIGGFVAVAAIAMSFLIPRLISRMATSRWSNSTEPNSETFKKLFPAFQTQLILGCACLEGAAFLNVFLYYASKSIIPLVAFVVCIALLLARIPTKRKIQAWIAKRL